MTHVKGLKGGLENARKFLYEDLYEMVNITDMGICLDFKRKDILEYFEIQGEVPIDLSVDEFIEYLKDNCKDLVVSEENPEYVFYSDKYNMYEPHIKALSDEDTYNAVMRMCILKTCNLDAILFFRIENCMFHTHACSSYLDIDEYLLKSYLLLIQDSILLDKLSEIEVFNRIPV